MDNREAEYRTTTVISACLTAVAICLALSVTQCTIRLNDRNGFNASLAACGYTTYIKDDVRYVVSAEPEFLKTVRSCRRKVINSYEQQRSDERGWWEFTKR